MSKAAARYSIDMTHGPLFSRIVLFALPLMATGMLQLLFHATNMMVLGKFSSQQSLGAVGATASLCGLLINTSLGLAIGANVLIANYIGSREWKKVSRTTHTALLLSLIVGGIVAVTGVLLSRQLLIWTKAPDDVIDLACIYMQIYFAAVPLNVADAPPSEVVNCVFVFLALRMLISSLAANVLMVGRPVAAEPSPSQPNVPAV